MEQQDEQKEKLQQMSLLINLRYQSEQFIGILTLSVVPVFPSMRCKERAAE